MMAKIVVAFAALTLAPAGLVLGPDPMRVAEVRSTFSALTSAEQALERDPSLIARVHAHPATGSLQVSVISKDAATEEQAKREALVRQSNDRHPAQKINALLAWKTLEEMPAYEYWDATELREAAGSIHRRLAGVEAGANARAVIAHVLLVIGGLAALWALLQRKQGSPRAGGMAVAGALIPLLWLGAMASMSTTFMIGFILACFLLLVSGLRTFVTPRRGSTGVSGTGGVTP